jgi:hypothetical protein
VLSKPEETDFTTSTTVLAEKRTRPSLNNRFELAIELMSSLLEVIEDISPTNTALSQRCVVEGLGVLPSWAFRIVDIMNRSPFWNILMGLRSTNI